MKIKQLFFFTEREKFLINKVDITLPEIEEWIQLSYLRKVKVSILIFFLMEIFFHSTCILPSEVFFKEDKVPFIALEILCFLLATGVLCIYIYSFRGKSFWEIKESKLKSIANYKASYSTSMNSESQILSRIKTNPLFGEIFPEALVLEKKEYEEEKKRGYFSGV